MTVTVLHPGTGLPEANPDTSRARSVPPGMREPLDVLRGTLRRTRAASALLAEIGLVPGGTGLQALEVLCIRLAVAQGRPMRCFAPGTSTASFDEAWMLGVFDARARGDAASYRFLLRQRFSPAVAAEMHFLFCRAHSALDS